MTIRRWEILNFLIEKSAYRSYLEIGVAGGATFRKILAHEKTGVDPALRRWSMFKRGIKKTTSDRFFSRNRRTFDLVFVDGLHTCHQTYRDIRNALGSLNAGGTIVVHDCLPASNEEQLVPRVQVSWTGDVWRAFLLASLDPGLHTFVLDCDRGCGIIRKEARPSNIPSPPGHIEPLNASLSWKEFDRNKRHWLRIVPESQVYAALEHVVNRYSA